jgi:hypothetical protein
MQKVKKMGRPKATVETEQVAVRLPKYMIDLLKPHVSEAIRNRLGRSFFDDERDQHLVKLAGQIEELANDVRRTTGCEWHTDKLSHEIFIEALRLLFDGLPVPEQQVSTYDLGDPRTAARTLYNRYAEQVRELEQSPATKMKPTVRSQLEKRK